MISLDSDSSQKLKDYSNLVIRYNAAFNLTGATSIHEFYSEHIMDALSAADIIKDRFTGSLVYDVGSGCGVPGIPLAIYFKDKSFVLLERSKKRCSFLNIAISLLSLGDRVSVLNKDLSDVKHEIEFAVCRAITSFDKIYKVFLSSLKDGATLILYKGKKTECLLDDYSKFVSSEIIPVDFLEKERNIVILKS